MKRLTRLLSCLLVLVLLFAAGCTNETHDPQETATPENGTEATATPVPTPAPTPAPTLPATEAPPASKLSLGKNLIPAVSADFNDATALEGTAWTKKYGRPTVSLDTNDEDDTVCLKFVKSVGAAASFHTAAIDILPFITEPGEYRIAFYFKVDADKGGSPFSCAVRTGTKQFTFADHSNDGQYFAACDAAPSVSPDSWETYETYITVEEQDLKNAGGKAFWDFCMHEIRADVSAVYIDDFSVCHSEITASEYLVENAVTWVAAEMVFVSDKNYTDPLFDAEADLILTKGEQSLTFPLFWDGGSVWRVRVACPEAGEWTWTTVCTDRSNKGLHGRSGKINCTKYDGPLAVYQHGFVKTDPEKKYFVYDDGTPFFYLGDTHWGLGGESTAMLEDVLKVRALQGFSVIQSEPLNASISVHNGIGSDDLNGFRDLDALFARIAAYGMTHANAQFFAPDYMTLLIANFGGYSEKLLGYATHSSGKVAMYDYSDTFKAALKAFARYWVARYGAYPVMWTLGQEVDNDYFWHRDGFMGHEGWSYFNNPYRLLATYIGQVDPYNHPLSAHQEHVNYTKATNSAFRDIPAHTWYAAQWSQLLNEPFNFTVPQDYYFSGQGKPAVLYEGFYCYLWTKDFGARAQGWMAFLNGMCGYGWGGQNTWCYGSTYSCDASSTDGVDTVTIDDKRATWQSALKFESPKQCGYMRQFFEETVVEWYDLIPRFSDRGYFAPDTEFYMLASNKENTRIVAYFYNFSETSVAARPNSLPDNATKTGTLNGLTAGAEYAYEWFDPATGRVTGSGTFKASDSGSWAIPAKAATDMVLYVHK